jgi:hypothetical protein
MRYANGAKVQINDSVVVPGHAFAGHIGGIWPSEEMVEILSDAPGETSRRHVLWLNPAFGVFPAWQ